MEVLISALPHKQKQKQKNRHIKDHRVKKKTKLKIEYTYFRVVQCCFFKSNKHEGSICLYSDFHEGKVHFNVVKFVLNQPYICISKFAIQQAGAFLGWSLYNLTLQVALPLHPN